MESLIEPEPRALCRVADLPDGGAKGFPPAPGGFTGLMAVRQGEAIYVYVNSCPHIGTPLDWTPDRFLSADGKHLICATHGATFSIVSGECTAGPCRGDFLEPIRFEIKEGVVYVPHDAGL